MQRPAAIVVLLALSAFAAPRVRAADASAPDAALSARLDYAASLNGAIDRPAKLAQLCLDARIACGFELRADVWKRPGAKRRIPSATVGQALEIFMGDDYRLAWRDGVLLVTPAAPGPAPLDAEVSADTREQSPANPTESLRAVARKSGLRLSAGGKPPRPGRAAAGVSMPAPARRVLAVWNRPEQARPNSWVAVYSRDGRSGKLYWYWGEAGRLQTIVGRRTGPPQMSWLLAQ